MIINYIWNHPKLLTTKDKIDIELNLQTSLCTRHNYYDVEPTIFFPNYCNINVHEMFQNITYNNNNNNNNNNIGNLRFKGIDIISKDLNSNSLFNQWCLYMILFGIFYDIFFSLLKITLANSKFKDYCYKCYQK
eukprot:Pgem_evm1s19352